MPQVLKTQFNATTIQQKCNLMPQVLKKTQFNATTIQQTCNLMLQVLKNSIQSCNYPTKT